MTQVLHLLWEGAVGGYREVGTTQFLDMISISVEYMRRWRKSQIMLYLDMSLVSVKLLGSVQRHHRKQIFFLWLVPNTNYDLHNIQPQWYHSLDHTSQQSRLCPGYLTTINLFVSQPAWVLLMTHTCYLFKIHDGMYNTWWI